MKAVKIRIEVPVTSFRYPHFLIGRQASFMMPPPSTIYGHIAGAVGQWFDPESCPVYSRDLVQRTIEVLRSIDGQMVDESRLQILLDRLYTGSIADWWQDQVLGAAKAFETEVLSHLYPFESDDHYDPDLGLQLDLKALNESE